MIKEEPAYPLPPQFGELEFLSRTPARGDAYYDKQNDRSIIIYGNSIKFKICKTRNHGKIGVDKYAHNFSDCTTYPL